MFPVRPTPQELSRPWRTSFNYIPRQVLQRYQSTMQSNPGFRQDRDQLPILTSMMEESSIRVSHERATSVQAESVPYHFGDNCASSLTRCHDLACGHTVEPGPNSEDAARRKKPCGPNCTRYVFLKSSGLNLQSFSSICEVKFVCANCIETWIREQFKNLNEQRSLIDGKPIAKLRETTEYEVVFWTHRLVARLVDNYFLEYHMRPAEGVSGVFRLSDVDIYTHMDAPSADIALSLNFTGHKINYALAWTAARHVILSHHPREATHGRARNRSASPTPDTDVSDIDLNEEEPLLRSKKNSKQSRQLRYRSPIRTRGLVKKTKEQEKLERDIDQLADRLFDTKVGEDKGEELMGKLMSNLGLMSVSEKMPGRDSSYNGIQDHVS